MIKKIPFILFFLLTACVYRIDIQQGNILAQKDIDKLRPDLTKNQVVFVLGSPVVDNAFSDKQWIYLYSYKNSRNDSLSTKRLVLNFDGDKLISAESSDYEIPEDLKAGSAQ